MIYPRWNGSAVSFDPVKIHGYGGNDCQHEEEWASCLPSAASFTQGHLPPGRWATGLISVVVIAPAPDTRSPWPTATPTVAPVTRPCALCPENTAPSPPIPSTTLPLAWPNGPVRSCTVSAVEPEAETPTVADSPTTNPAPLVVPKAMHPRKSITMNLT